MRVDLLRPVVMPTETQINRLLEQTDYLEGVLWADPELRLDKALDAGAEIDMYGTGTKAFWRGLLETSGYMGVASCGDRAYPRIELRASHSILTKFLAFLQEEIHTRQGIAWPWDADGKLAFQALGEFVRVTGQKAQDICRCLYVDQTVGRTSARQSADKIMAWAGRK